MLGQQLDVILGRLDGGVARPAGTAVRVEHILAGTPQEVQPDEQRLTVAVIVVIKGDRRDIIMRPVFAHRGDIFPGGRRIRDQILAIEQNLRVGAKRKAERLALELCRAGEGGRIPVHRNAVTSHQIIDRHQPVGVWRPPAVEIVHHVEIAVRGDALGIHLFLQRAEGDEGPLGLDPGQLGEFVVTKHQTVKLRRDHTQDVQLGSGEGLALLQIIGHVAGMCRKAGNRQGHRRNSGFQQTQFSHSFLPSCCVELIDCIETMKMYRNWRIRIQAG